MGIALTENQTILTCDTCGSVTQTSVPDGVVPDDWITGQLWIDLSLGEQLHRPLCFCPACHPQMHDGLRISVSRP